MEKPSEGGKKNGSSTSGGGGGTEALYGPGDPLAELCRWLSAKTETSQMQPMSATADAEAGRSGVWRSPSTDYFLRCSLLGVKTAWTALHFTTTVLVFFRHITKRLTRGFHCYCRSSSSSHVHLSRRVEKKRIKKKELKKYKTREAIQHCSSSSPSTLIIDPFPICHFLIRFPQR